MPLGRILSTPQPRARRSARRRRFAENGKLLIGHRASAPGRIRNDSFTYRLCHCSLPFQRASVVGRRIMTLYVPCVPTVVGLLIVTWFVLLLL